MFLIFRTELSLHPLPESITLSRDEGRHIRARRLKDGALIYIGDGAGKRFKGFLQENGRQVASIESDSICLEKRTVLITAIPSGRRWDLLLEKATELGVTEIYPAIFRYSDRKDFSQDRARRIIEEAAAQSQRYILPEIHAVKHLADIIKVADRNTVFLHHRTIATDQIENTGTNSIEKSTARQQPDDRITSIIVGPEGGLADSDIEIIKSYGFLQLALPLPILRIETAALAGLTYLALHDSAGRFSNSGSEDQL